MFSIPEHLRKNLLAKGALVRNDEGDIVFAGLTPAESNFYADYSRRALNEISSDERNLYRQLHLRHLSARLESLETQKKNYPYSNPPASKNRVKKQRPK